MKGSLPSFLFELLHAFLDIFPATHHRRMVQEHAPSIDATALFPRVSS